LLLVVASYLKVIKKKSLLLLLLHWAKFFVLILNLYIHIYIYIVDINTVSSANPKAFQFTAIRQLNDKKWWPIGFEVLINNNKNNVNLRLEKTEYGLLNYLIGILSICLISIINCL